MWLISQTDPDENKINNRLHFNMRKNGDDIAIFTNVNEDFTSVLKSRFFIALEVK